LKFQSAEKMIVQKFGRLKQEIEILLEIEIEIEKENENVIN